MNRHPCPGGDSLCTLPNALDTLIDHLRRRHAEKKARAVGDTTHAEQSDASIIAERHKRSQEAA